MTTILTSRPVGGTPAVVLLRPAPATDPPYEDEPAQPGTAARGPGSPTWPVPVGPVPRRAPGRDRPPRPGGPAGGRTDPPAAPAAVPATGVGTAEAPLAWRSAYLFVTQCVEVLGGFRPVRHLRPFVTPERFDAVSAALLRTPQGGRTHPRRAGTGTTGVPVPVRSRGARVIRVVGDRVTLRHLRVSEPAAGVAEVTAVVGRDGRAWAIAVRMRLEPDGWRVILLQVV